ncbi:hypothetical protein P692DRAFT_20957020 [Suillus brevipes Sb2]|nr:hypothetical protein P692DRAFT_20957020 [Suillus brevipes Sb2]
MVVYPQPPEGQHLTPSPFVDALQSAIHEVCDIKAQQNVAPLAREQSTEKPADNNDILRRLASIEERFGSEIADLKQENVGLRHEVKELMRVNAGLQHEVEEQGRVIYGLKDDNAQLKRDNAQLKDDNAQLKDDNAQLKRDNAQLKHDFKELRSQMEETNRAVLGVRPIILLYHFSHSHLGLTG